MKRRRVGPAYRIFPSERTVKFEEMEYELPRANGWPALREVIALDPEEQLPVAFPFEFRIVAADDIWLSPFNGREGASISMHQYHRMKWRDDLRRGRAIFRAHDGRPHWAKRHTLTHADVHQLYPHAGEILRRARRDRSGREVRQRASSELFGVAGEGRLSHERP